MLFDLALSPLIEAGDLWQTSLLLKDLYRFLEACKSTFFEVLNLTNQGVFCT